MDKEAPATGENSNETPHPVVSPDAGKSGPQDKNGASGPLFTQEQLDAIMQKRVSREQEKAQQRTEQAVADAKKEADTRVAEAQNQLSQEQAKAQAAAFAALVTVEAVKNGVTPDNVEAFTRLVPADTVVGEDGTVDKGKVAEAIKTVLGQFPGLAHQPPKGVGGVPQSASETPALTLAQAIGKRLEG